VHDFVQEKLIALETTARLLSPTVSTDTQLGRTVNPLMSSHPLFRQLLLVDREKRIRVEVSRLSRLGSRDLHERIEEELPALASRISRYISPVYVDLTTSEPMVVIAVAAKDVFGDFQGALVAEVNLKFMWELVAGLRIGKTGFAYVVDRKGTLIAFGEISRVLRGGNVPGIKPVREFIDNLPSSVQARADTFTGIKGTPVLGAYFPLGEPDWAVVTELPVAEAYRATVQTTVAVALFTVLMAGLSGLASMYISRRLSVPLTGLMKTALRIAGGERHLQAEIEGPREIANLATDFNSMTVQLRELIGRLERRSQHLQAVVERYVEYMAEVGRGKLDFRLALEQGNDDTDEPLVVLGRQLNETTAQLELHERKLQVYYEKLKQSNKELAQFAYVASHDLQEPLRKIRFFADRLKAQYGASEMKRPPSTWTGSAIRSGVWNVSFRIFWSIRW